MRIDNTTTDDTIDYNMITFYTIMVTSTTIHVTRFKRKYFIYYVSYSVISFEECRNIKSLTFTNKVV